MDKWYDDQLGSSNSFGNRKEVSQGNFGTNFWGRGMFTYKGDDILEKAKLLGAVKNFVRILTGMNIPVRYSTKEDESYTDGNSITIAGNVAKEFDPTVGLALHEGSHIAKTNFSILRTLQNNPASIMDKKYHNHKELIKQILNWVEDRRIDNWAYTTSPGYKVYYLALYKRYFNSEEVNKILQSGKRLDLTTGSLVDTTTESVENYMFYLINLTNPLIKLNELKGLREIWDLVDLKNIDRLENTKEALDIALGIFDIIAKYVPKQNMEEYNDQNIQKKQGEGEGEDDGSEFDGSLEDLMKAIKEGKEGQGGKPIKLSKRLLKELKKALKKQKEFVEGKVKKEKVEEATAKKVDALIESETEEHPVKVRRQDFDVVTVNKITRETMEADIYNIFNRGGDNTASVEEGFTLGMMLGKKLQTRTEERVLLSNKLKSGKIDKKMLHAAGYHSENIFYNKSVDKYDDMSVHLSLDLSGSMSGSKWDETLIATIAIAKATSMVKGIRTQISLRYSDSLSGKEQPIVICFYDSLYDKVQKLRWFDNVNPAGATPEGLCYEGLMKKIMKPLLNKNTLFINFSDGAPGMDGLGGTDGIDVTRDSIKKMRNSGVKILSYFIGRDGDSCASAFRQMYGDKDSKFIDVNEIVPLAKTINDCFLDMGRMNG